ncbi:MAG TPA: hypothetical protein VMF13_12540 [Luteitalea sp.]|nr:hypothetical protein [Luteitalea sp.]
MSSRDGRKQTVSASTCQHGAHGRARADQGFIAILRTYHTGPTSGRLPLAIGRRSGGPPTLRQRFVAPNATGILEIHAGGLKGLRVHINEQHDLSLDAAALASDVVRVDVAYLVGLSEIRFNLVGAKTPPR